MTQLEKIEYLKSRVFNMSNSHCFIEKERFIRELPPRIGQSESCYAELFSDLLDRVSTPVDENDIFVGRVVEALPEEIPAAPDGRRAYKPVSENQSPTYGTDKNGITALLSSMARLPFERTAAGGLNLIFSSSVRAEILNALISTYFAKGGLHAGITVLRREELLDAMENPEKYSALTVRLYGFSEYFICMPKWQQEAVLERTVY